jgi:predicted dehydrogenase
VREVHVWTNRPIWPQGGPRPKPAEVPEQLDWKLWLGVAPYRPYAVGAYHTFAWRGWWDFGTGALGDMACHIMDAAFWILDLRDPAWIASETSTLFTETAPKASRITYHFPTRGGRPEVTVVWRDGGLFPPRPTGWPAEEAWPPAEDGGQLWIGTDGAMVAGTYGGNPRLVDPTRDRELKADPPPTKYPRVESVYAEWIAACKGGPPAGSNFVDHAGPLTEMVLLGNLAIRSGRTLTFDANGKITEADIPKEWYAPPYRTGWRL